MTEKIIKTTTDSFRCPYCTSNHTTRGGAESHIVRRHPKHIKEGTGLYKKLEMRKERSND